MMLKLLYFEVFTFLGNSGGFDNAYCSQVRNRADVFALYLKEWLKRHAIDSAGHRMIQLIPVAADRGRVTFFQGKTLCVGIPIENPRSFGNLSDDISIFDFVFDVLDRGIEIISEDFLTDLSMLQTGVSEFKVAEFQFDMVTAKKKFRELNMDFLIKVHVDTQAISAKLVGLQNGNIVYSEPLMQTNPFSFLLKNTMKSIKIDGDSISIPQSIPTSIPIGKLKFTSHGDWTHKLPSLESYNWSRKLSEIL